MKTKRTMTRSLFRILLVTGLVLAVPLVANQFIEGEGWSVFDFVFAGTLLMGTGLLYEWGSRKAGTRVSAVATAALAAIGGAAVVFGEVDDAPGLVLMGIVFVIGAVALGVKAAGRRPEAPDGHPATSGSA